MDLTQTLINTTISANGGNARPIKPSPRPKTAFPGARDRIAQANHEEMTKKLLRRGRTVD